jgi:RNA polymerase sigma-70 factor (ECF subfamily)
MTANPPPAEAIDQLLLRVQRQEPEALDQLLDHHRAYLRTVVALRFDPHLRTRLDPSDIVQEGMIDAVRRLEDFLRRQPMPFTLWLRQTILQKFIDLRRQHLGAECRAVKRELRLPSSSSVLLAKMLLDDRRPPDRRVSQEELAQRVQQAMADLSEEDSDLLLMRHFEGLTNQQAAAALGIEPAAASKRYGRALLRLRKLLADLNVSGPLP